MARVRNPEIAPGIRKYSRSSMTQIRRIAARHKFQNKDKKQVTKKEAPKKKEQKKTRIPRFCSIYKLRKQLPSVRAHVNKPTKLRESLVPGTICILLSGPYKGRKVVFLKQLDSGLLLITGPFLINGVPLRRINQTSVIATSTHLDVKTLALNDVTDQLFRKPKEKKAKKGSEKSFFNQKSAGKKAKKTFSQVSADFKKHQKKVDAQITPLIGKTPLLRSYLKTPFCLTRGQYPHMMKF